MASQNNKIRGCSFFSAIKLCAKTYLRSLKIREIKFHFETKNKKIKIMSSSSYFFQKPDLKHFMFHTAFPLYFNYIQELIFLSGSYMKSTQTFSNIGSKYFCNNTKFYTAMFKNLPTFSKLKSEPHIIWIVNLHSIDQTKQNMTFTATFFVWFHTMYI